MIPSRFTLLLFFISTVAAAPLGRTQNAHSANDTTAVAELDVIQEAEQEPNPWRFNAGMPAWITFIDGTTGLKGVTADLDIDFKDILENVDMIFAFRGEIEKGPFGVSTDFMFLAASDGVTSEGIISNVDFEFQQSILDIGFRYRLIEKPEGWIDFLIGFRYINIEQSLGVGVDEAKIPAAVANLADQVETGVTNGFGEGQVRDLVENVLSNRLGSLAEENSIPGAPFNRQKLTSTILRLQRKIESVRGALQTAIANNDQPAIDALKAEIRETAAEAIGDLDRKASRTDDWFDPYVGLRGRYNINKWLYLTARGDIGGFGVGSDLTWQAEGAFGFQVTKHIFAETGYRALSIDYNQDGFINDTLTHGVQLTLGYQF